MALLPILQLVSISSTADRIVVKDSTGNYDASTNPGGFGAPNPAISAIRGAIFRLTSFNDLSKIYSYKVPDHTVLFDASGITLQPSYFTGGSVFLDGVYDIKYDLLLTPNTTNVLSFTGGTKQFTLTNASTVFASAVGFYYDGNIYLIDQSKTLNASGGYVTTVFPGTIPVSVNPTGSNPYSVIIEGDLKFLNEQTGNNCLLSDIGIWSNKGCEDENFRDIWSRYKQRIAMKNKFANGYLTDTHRLAVYLSSYCTIYSSNCSC